MKLFAAAVLVLSVFFATAAVPSSILTATTCATPRRKPRGTGSAVAARDRQLSSRSQVRVLPGAPDLQLYLVLWCLSSLGEQSGD
jgi:hypothetical protein